MTHTSGIDRMVASNAEVLVLVVDDDSTLRKQICHFLECAGFTTIAASNGPEAIHLVKEHTPSLALVDLYMPGMNGYALTQQLKSLYGLAVHIAVLSGLDTPDERVRAFDAGADDFIAKPAFWPEVVRRIRAAHRLQYASAQLRQEQAYLERLQVYAAEATTLLAHDLDNGFCVALSNLESFSAQTIPPDRAQQALASAQSAIHRMAGLVRNFIDIGRFEDSVLQAHRKTISIEDIVRNVVNIHEFSIHLRTCTLRIEAPAESLAHVDPVLIERVLHNLLGNAIRYVHHQGTISIKIAIEPQNGASSLHILVCNSGPSIPPQIQPTIFDKYIKMDNDDRRSRGMGLYFCRLACEAHEGTIGCKSEEGNTCFDLNIPFSL